MYQLNDNKEWDTEYLYTLLGDKRIFSSREAQTIRADLEKVGALPDLGNNFDWAMLCIGYCFAVGLTQKPNDWETEYTRGNTEIPSFETCFTKEYARLWLVLLSDVLFTINPNKKVGKDDLYKLIETLWHTGAKKLWARWQACKQYQPDDELAARQVFLNELVELAIKNAGKVQNNVSGSLNNLIASEKLNAQCDELKQALDNTVGKSGTIASEYSGVRYDCFRVQFDRFVDLERYHAQICSELGVGDNNMRCERIEGAANTWHINILRDESTWQKPSKTEFQAALAQYKSSSKHFRLPVCIGIDERGEPQFEDYATAPHAIIGGETMSGKTVFVRSMLLSLFELCPQNTEIVVVYCKKKTDFAAVEGYPNLWQQKLVIEPSEACEILQQFVEEMDRRYRLLDEYGVENVDELPENVRCKYTILMVDELADLIMSNKDVENHLIRLAQKARAANIYLMLATQRPDSTVLPGLLRDNLPTKIALKVGKHQSSTIILGESGAERLAKHGDHLVKWNGGATQFLHGYNV